MNMLTSVLIKLGLALFSALPIERIVAILLTKWVDRIDTTNMAKALKTCEHLNELAVLFGDILADKQIDAEEVSRVRESVVRARTLLLELWAKGAAAKGVQAALADAGVRTEYVEPLLKTDK